MSLGIVWGAGRRSHLMLAVVHRSVLSLWFLMKALPTPAMLHLLEVTIDGKVAGYCNVWMIVEYSTTDGK